MDQIIKEIIKKFKLKPLKVEGGYFREIYRSNETLQNGRSLSTAIIYLLTKDNFSKLHRLPYDEIFHFYWGDEVMMLNLYDDGTSDIIKMGSDIFSSSVMQAVVPKNTWQALKLMDGGKYALIGTTMAPGFSYEDYIDGRKYKEELINKYPERKKLINIFI